MGDLVLRLSHGPPRYVIGVDNPARWLGCPCGPRNIDLNRHRCPKWSTLDTFHPFVACPDLLLSSVGFWPDSTSQCSSPLVSVGFVSHSIVFVLSLFNLATLKFLPRPPPPDGFQPVKNAHEAAGKLQRQENMALTSFRLLRFRRLELGDTW